MTNKQSAASRRAKGQHKYKAKPRRIDGHYFASKAEGERYLKLKQMEKEGLIVNLELQPKFPLKVNGTTITTYIGDFRYVDVETDQVILEDVKGVITPVYKIKKKLLKVLHDIDIVEVIKGVPQWPT